MRYIYKVGVVIFLLMLSNLTFITSAAPSVSDCANPYYNNPSLSLTSTATHGSPHGISAAPYLMVGDKFGVTITNTDYTVEINGGIGAPGAVSTVDGVQFTFPVAIEDAYTILIISHPTIDLTVGFSCIPGDADSDGVTNDIDLCPATPSGDTVDSDGCTVVVVIPVVSAVTPTITFSAPEISDGRENPKKGDSNLVLYSTTLDGSPALVAYEVEGSKGVFACFITEADFAGDAPAENTFIRTCGQSTRLYRLTDGQVQANTLINGKETAIIFDALPPTRVRSYIVGEGS